MCGVREIEYRCTPLEESLAPQRTNLKCDSQTIVASTRARSRSTNLSIYLSLPPLVFLLYSQEWRI